jgi:hypothetical protein
MASAKSLIKAVSKVINMVGPMARTSYLRTTVYTGADELIGRGGSSQNFDVLFNPQPVFRQLGHRQAMYLSTATCQLVSDDYHFTFPTTQFDVTAFEDPRVSLVLTDANGEETFRILYTDPVQYAGQDVAINVFVRSTGHSTVSTLNIAAPSGAANQTVQQYVDAAIANVEEEWGSF